MKKIIICLLIFCIIVLGCLAFTGCDKQSDDDIPRNTFWKVENSPLSNDCYAFFYTGEYKTFYINYYYSHYGQDEYSTKYFSYSLYVETLTRYPGSSNHSHIIKPNSIIYIPTYAESDYGGGAYIYPPIRLEYVTYDSYTNGIYVNEKVVFTTTFTFTDFTHIESNA